MRDMRQLALCLKLGRIVEPQKPLRAEESDISDGKYVDHKDGLSEAIDNDLNSSMTFL